MQGFRAEAQGFSAAEQGLARPDQGRNRKCRQGTDLRSMAQSVSQDCGYFRGGGRVHLGARTCATGSV